MSEYETFMRESNAIEGEVDSCGRHCCDHRKPGKLYDNDVEAVKYVIDCVNDELEPSVHHILHLHKILSEDRPLQYKGEWRRCNVTVAGRMCPIYQDVPSLMERYFGMWHSLTSYEAHHKFEGIHPFEDLNGRTGRLLWLWRMIEQTSEKEAFALPFLHRYYYQSLSYHNP